MRNSSAYWGVVILLAGLILLLDVFDIISVSPWDLIFPMFIIALGIWILWFALRKPSSEVVVEEIPLNGTEEATIQIKHGAGKFSLTDGDNPLMLMQGKFGGGVVKKVQKQGSKTNVRLEMPSFNFGFDWAPGGSINWDLKFNREVPLSIDFQSGAGDMVLDLSKLKVSNLTYKSGASANKVLMPENAGFTDARFSTGVSTLNIQIPDGVSAQIQAKAGVSAVNVDTKRFPRIGNYYKSPDWETATNKAAITIDVGVGSVEIH
jgi:hypothetical protein